MTFDVQAARAALAEASAGIDGADLPYHPAALQAMRTGEALLAEVERLTAEVAYQETECAAAETDWSRFGTAEATRADRLQATITRIVALLDAAHAEGRTWIPMADVRRILDQTGKTPL